MLILTDHMASKYKKNIKKSTTKFNKVVCY